MSGHWPPDWEDSEEEFPEEADQPDATALTSGGEALLSEVAAYLASVPAPVLPDAVEARINAALAAEAATRADHAATRADHAVPADTSRKLGPTPKRARVRRRWGGGRPHLDSLSRQLLIVGSLVVCLLLAGLVVTLSHSSSSSSSYSSLAGGPAAGANHGAASSSGVSSADEPGSSARSSAGRVAPTPSPFFASASSTSPNGPRATTAVPRKSASASAPSASASASSASAAASSASASLAPTASATAPTTPTAVPTAAPTASVSFVVTASGTKYQAATLAPQVQARLYAPHRSGASPSAALLGCVSHLTGGQAPLLVDQATYQGSPAYIIAISSQAWVVGLGCTAAKPELVTSVPLAG